MSQVRKNKCIYHSSPAFFWLTEKYIILFCWLTASTLFGFKILAELAFTLYQEMDCKNTNIVSLSGVDTGF